MASVLVVGGSGYIGTHVMVELALRGHQVICLDNYSTGTRTSLYEAQTLAPEAIRAYEGDFANQGELRWLLETHHIDSVIHLACLKNIGDSLSQPDLYRKHNVEGSRVLFQALAGSRVRDLVFASSAAVYGDCGGKLCAEDSLLSPSTPYGETNVQIESMLGAWIRSHEKGRVAVLRCFNVAGAHETGCIGEGHATDACNLVPSLCQVAAGERPHLRIFGDDYPTADGTCVRDYVHVMDTATAHACALASLDRSEPGAFVTVNIGSGKSHSVRQVAEIFEKATGTRIRTAIAPRRPGDVGYVQADISRARSLLGWEPQRDMQQICRHAWTWQRLRSKVMVPAE